MYLISQANGVGISFDFSLHLTWPGVIELLLLQALTTC